MPEVTVKTGDDTLDSQYMTKLHARIKRAVDDAGEFKHAECIYVLLTIIAMMTAGLDELDTPERIETFAKTLGKEMADRITKVQAGMAMEEARHSVKH